MLGTSAALAPRAPCDIWAVLLLLASALVLASALSSMSASRLDPAPAVVSLAVERRTPRHTLESFNNTTAAAYAEERELRKRFAAGAQLRAGRRATRVCRARHVPAQQPLRIATDFPYLRDWMNGAGCASPCTVRALAAPHDDLAGVHVLLLNERLDAPDMRERAPDVLVGVFSFEPATFQFDKRAIELADFLVALYPHSELLTSYAYRDMFNLRPDETLAAGLVRQGRAGPSYRVPDPAGKVRAGALFISQCLPLSYLRTSLIAELARHMPLYNFGTCVLGEAVHMAPPPELAHISPAELRADKHATVSRFRFFISFENSINASYYTEKLFGALIVDTVTVYLGPPDVHEVMPAGAFVRADEFASPRALAEFLGRMSDATWRSMFAWRTHSPPAVPARLEALVRNSVLEPPPRSFLCRTCDFVREHYR